MAAGDVAVASSQALDPRFRILPTQVFSVVEEAICTTTCSQTVCISCACAFTRPLVARAFEVLGWRIVKHSDGADLHWGDYEALDWQNIVSGRLRANSFCVRKGLSRKAQLSMYARKYASKRPQTPLQHALPRTLVIDTWEAFDDELKFNLWGDIAAFGADLGVRQSLPLAARLDWCLAEAAEWMTTPAEAANDGNGGAGNGGYLSGCGGKEDANGACGIGGSADGGGNCSGSSSGGCGSGDASGGGSSGSSGGCSAGSSCGKANGCVSNGVQERGAERGGGDSGSGSNNQGLWILKPSTLNKAAEISLIHDFEALRQAVFAQPDIREWVLQEYIRRPLLLRRRKFHIRAYVLAVGCLRLFFFDEVLVLSAGRDYDASDLSDRLAHLTNTAAQAESEDFNEEDSVKLLPDLEKDLCDSGLSAAESAARVAKILRDMKTLSAELFRAFRGEACVFCPLPHCFEVFGLDFLVDQNYHVWLLEANPGPDFKQTGKRLKHVIQRLMEATARVCCSGSSGGEVAEAPREQANGGGGGGRRRLEEEDVRVSCGDGGGGLMKEDGAFWGYSLVLDEEWTARGFTATQTMT